MIASLIHQASFGAALRRALAWPAQVGAARRSMGQLARMSDIELRDIGLVRQDIVDADALRPNANRSAPLAHHRTERERPSSGRADLAA